MPTSFWIKAVFRTGRILVLVYALLCLGLLIFQRTLIYFPYHASESYLRAQARVCDLEPWRSEQGDIIGWTRRPPSGTVAQNRLLVFHGNTGYALLRTHFVDGFESLGRGSVWQVYIFEYPGFGARQGVIGEASFRMAAKEAILALKRDDQRPLFLLGESLGSGLACAEAKDVSESVAGLLLLTPYATMLETAQYHYPFVPIRLLLRDRWDNLEAIRGFPGPVAAIVAGVDKTIPPSQGERLLAAAPGPKLLKVMPGIGHNEIDFSPSAQWWLEVSEFLIANQR